MAIDKIFKNSYVDDLADNVLNEVDDFMVSVDKMQQQKVAGNVQRVVQAFKQIETNITEKFDNVSNVIEKRVLTIKDGRDGINGSDGRNGEDGRNGKDGINGKPGLQGPPGKDGIDGTDGVSVTDANIDFDGSLIINLSSGKQINAGEIVSPELEKQIIAITRGGGSSGSGGDVMGPTSATDNAVARFDGTTGKLIQNSAVIITDAGNVSGVGTLSASGGATIQGMTVGRGAGAVVSNTVVGNGALATNSTGVFNTAVGINALNAATIADDNTAIGNAALQSAITGANNTAVGSNALGNLETGNQNVAIGDGALSNLDGYASNVAVGPSAMSTAQCDEAIGVGFSAVASNTATGTVGIGSLALSSNTSGVGQTAVGYYALKLSTGGGNTAMGYQAGSAITTGANNTVLGAYTGSAAPISATGSNYIVLSDGAGTVRQTIDSTGKVGFGTTSPNAALEVSSVTGSATPVPTEVRITTSTSAADWSTTLPWARLGFYSFDASTAGPKLHASINVIHTALNGGTSSLNFNTSDTTGALTERMRIDQLGNVGVGTTAPSASAILDVQSTTKGVRMPNMTTTQKNAIASPAAGLMIFDTTLAKLCVYASGAWQTITSV